MKLKELLEKGVEIFAHENNPDFEHGILTSKNVVPFRIYSFIYNCITARIDFVNPEMQKVLGYEPEDFTIEFLFEIIHPEDKEKFIAHETRALEFCRELPTELQDQYYIVHDFRLKTSSGAYVRILQQAFASEMVDGNLVKTKVIHSDISHVKNQSDSQLHFIGLEGQPSYYNVMSEEHPFSEKEKEILAMMVQGLTSEAIAQKLNRSIHTIRNHRKNILQKSGCINVQDLLVRATKEGWV